MEYIGLIWHSIVLFFHMIEWPLIVAGLSTLTLWLQLSPAGKAVPHLVLAVRAGLLIAQLFQIYIKNNPTKKVTPNQFFAEIAKHYLETHPTGKQIAKKTDLDTKLVGYALKHDDDVPGNG